jgi:predicted  nucleic acid-binding Zn-ribbon protein
MSFICEHCNATLSNKYTLKTHQETNKYCLGLRHLELNTNFKCTGCGLTSIDMPRLTNHQHRCFEYRLSLMQESYEADIKKIKSQLEDQKNEYGKKMEEQKNKHEKQIEEQKNVYEKMIEDQKNAYEKMIETVKSIATSNNVTNITNNTNSNNNNSNNTVFSDKFFLDQLDQDEIKRKLQVYITEQVVMEGQRAIAQVCTDHIIKTKDKKVLMKCTDVSRKKFKYMDENGNMNEDHAARKFTEKVYKPIKEVSKVVCDSMLSCINPKEDDENKSMRIMSSYTDIVNINNPKSNSVFQTELAVLNSK